MPGSTKPFDEFKHVVAPEKAPSTALCVETREGHLRVFLPPFTHLEHAVEQSSQGDEQRLWC